MNKKFQVIEDKWCKEGKDSKRLKAMGKCLFVDLVCREKKQSFLCSVFYVVNTQSSSL